MLSLWPLHGVLISHFLLTSYGVPHFSFLYPRLSLSPSSPVRHDYIIFLLFWNLIAHIKFDIFTYFFSGDLHFQFWFWWVILNAPRSFFLVSTNFLVSPWKYKIWAFFLSNFYFFFLFQELLYSFPPPPIAMASLLPSLLPR